MNYQHSYHAGNHTEVFKHSVLIHLIHFLQRKDRPIFVLDTHSGPGLYDLESTKSKKTGEAKEGILKVASDEAPTLQPLLEIVRSFNEGNLRHYPGSPSIIARLLRPGDRAAFCELQPERFVELQTFALTRKAISVHHRDGYSAARTLVPPRERRGVVFIDPPFESKDEMTTLTEALLAVHRKWANGVLVAWYPIKDQHAARSLKDELKARFVGSALSAEFLRYPIDGVRLAGSGIVIVNAPWQFDQLLRTLCEELLNAFGAKGVGSWRLDWICQPS